MIQCSSERFENGHRDTVTPIAKFFISGIGMCEIRVFPYQDDTNPPTIYIMQPHGLLCGIRLDKPLFWGREYKFTMGQKRQINNIMHRSVNANDKSTPPTWVYTKSIWKRDNDRLEKIPLPDECPDYRNLPWIK